MNNSSQVKTFRGWTIGTLALAIGPLLMNSSDAYGQATSAGAYNIKLLNSNQPDFSDAASFVRSCSYGWTANQEKAISLWKWTCLNRVQTDVSIGEFYERGLKPSYHGADATYQVENDFVTYLNSTPNQFCGYIAPAMGACWNLGTGQFYCTNNIAVHTTVDLWYDGKPHMFDPSLNNYVFNDQGAVAGAKELQQNFKMKDGNWWITNCPMRAGDTKTSQMLCDYRTLQEYAAKYDVVNQTRGGGEAINQVSLAIHPYTSYKRFKDAIAPTDENYFIPSRGDGDKQTFEGQGGGKFPNSYWNNNCSVTNGEWIIEPDFAQKDWAESACSAENVVRGNRAIQPVAAGTDASVIFNITPYNSVAHMQISAKAIKGEADTLEALISYDAGNTWTMLEPNISGDFSRIYRKEVLAKKAYLLKFHLRAATDAKSIALQSLKIRVITQVNRLSMFQLDRGNNKVYINLGEQLERIELRPDFKPETILASMYQSSNLTPGAGPFRTNAQLKASGQSGYAIYRIDAPGEIKRITMAGLFAVWDPNCPISLHYSTDMGKTWTRFTNGDVPLSDAIIGEKPPKSPEDIGNAQYAQKFCSDSIGVDGVRTVLLKVQLAPKKAANAYPNGIWKVWMAADYRPAAFKPFEVTVSWQEYLRDGSTQVRTYKKTVTRADPWTVLDVNVAGYRPPLMKYVTISAIGRNPDDVKEGYSDGVDVGAADGRTKYVYKTANNVARLQPVTANVLPDTKLESLPRLVDGVVKHNFFSSGARWTKGQNPQIVVALKEEQEIQGVSVHQSLDANTVTGQTASSYADAIDVSVSSDNANWTPAGRITRYDLYNWPGDYLPLGFEAMQFASNFSGGILDYNFPMAFDKPLHGKFVRFSVSNPNDPWAVTELRVWAEMKKIRWDHDNFRHDRMSETVSPELRQ